MTIPMHVPVIESDGGPWATHDVACPACTQRKAILILESGVFVPCSACLNAGWELVRWRTRWGRWRSRCRASRPDIYRAHQKERRR